VKKKKKLDNMV